MKFASLSHLINEQNIDQIPKSLIKDELIISPELDIFGTKGYLIALKLLPKQILTLPRNEIKKRILDATLFAQNKLDVDIIQLGALTTSVTNGGEWLAEQNDFFGFVNHGDSYTAAITCQSIMKTLDIIKKKPLELNLAIVGAYGIIGEAVSKSLVEQFSHSILIGPKLEKLKKLEQKIVGDFEIDTNLKTEKADIIITATSHHTALLKSEHLKKNAIIIDVSQPPNLSSNLCISRPDICRIDGGYVDFPKDVPMPIPSIPIGKNFACITEVIMQAMENEHKDHVGSIDLLHLKKTERWGEKYGFNLNQLTNFGKPIERL